MNRETYEVDTTVSHLIGRSDQEDDVELVEDWTLEGEEVRREWEINGTRYVERFTLESTEIELP